MPEGAKGYRFFFWSGDRAEPPHVHVNNGRSEAKVWLRAVEVEKSTKLAGHESPYGRILFHCASDPVIGWNKNTALSESVASNNKRYLNMTCTPNNNP